MKWILICAIALLSSLAAQEQLPDGEQEKFDVNGVISPIVAKLDEPDLWPSVGEAQMLVFSESLKAQEHVRKGFALIHASWDFEAYRHFVEAVKADPQCLMAYCGMVLSMTNPQHEFKEQRARAFNRMLTLAEYKVNEEYFYPDNERIYAIGLAEMFMNGVGVGAAVFRKLAEEYPNDLQARLLAAFLSRNGYNALGRPRLYQRESIAQLEKLVEEHPDDPMVLNFLIMVQAEAPYQALDFKKELLPLAQKLVKMSKGEIPSWQSLLGFVAWRSGEPAIAIEAFEKSVALYDEWRKRHGLDYADCEGLIRAQMHLAAILNEQGRREEALKVIDAVNAYQVGEGREESLGALTIKWHGNFMPFKMYIENKEYAQAKKILPTVVKNKAGELDPYSAVLVAYQLYIDVVLFAQEDKLAEAKAKHKRMALLLEEMKKLQVKAIGSPEYGDLLRSLNSLIMLHKELNALISTEGKLSYNWLQSAIDLQPTESRLLPPDVLYPMEYRMGEYLNLIGKKEQAREFFEKASQRRPCYKKADAEIFKLDTH